MRTTLTLDPDVAAALRRRMEQTGAGMKQVVNELLRAALAAEPRRELPASYSTPPHRSGRVLLPGVPNVHELLVAAEGEDYR